MKCEGSLVCSVAICPLRGSEKAAFAHSGAILDLGLCKDMNDTPQGFLQLRRAASATTLPLGSSATPKDWAPPAGLDDSAVFSAIPLGLRH